MDVHIYVYFGYRVTFNKNGVSLGQADEEACDANDNAGYENKQDVSILKQC